MSQADRIRALLDQGLTAYGLGRLEEARRAWAEVLALEPHNARALEYLRFLEDSFAPGQARQEDPQGPEERTDPGPLQPGPDAPPLASDQPTLRPRPLAQSQPPPASAEDFVPPGKPAVASATWGDLYDWGAQGAPPPPAAPAGAVPVVQPLVELSSPPPAPARAATSAISAVPTTPPAPVSVRVHAPPQSLPPLPALSAPPPPAGVRPEPPAAAPVSQHESAWTALTPPPIPAEEGAFSRPPTLDDIPPLGPAHPAPAIASPLGLVAGVPEKAGPAPDDVGALIRGARELLELDDFSGVLELVEKVLDKEPGHQEALFLREQASQELTRMFASKVGEVSRTPRVRMAEDEIIWLNLDHRAGFLLSLIDGHTTFEDILLICGLPQLEALRLLAQLIQEKVIEAE